MANPKTLSAKNAIKEQIAPYITSVKKAVDSKDIEALKAVYDAQDAVLSQHASNMRRFAESNLSAVVTEGKAPNQVSVTQASKVLQNMDQEVKSNFYNVVREAAEIALYESASQGKIPPRLTSNQVQAVAKLFATEADNLAKLSDEQKKKQIPTMVHKTGIFAKSKEPENDSQKPSVSAPRYGSKKNG